MTDNKFNPEQYTKYEKARILGARALQISANAPILIKLSNEELEKLNYDPIKIAELEFEAGVLPITVKRPLPRKIEIKTEEPVVEIIKEEKEIPKERIKSEEVIPEERARIEEAEEAEAEEAEMSEEEIAEEIESAETETSEEL